MAGTGHRVRDASSQLDEGGLLGAGQLVIEVVSPGSVRRDYEEKLLEYQEAGVAEYWIVDPRPRNRRVTFYVLREGHYERVEPGSDGIHRSPVIHGLWIRPDWLFTADADPMAAAAEVTASLRA
jgi:hypothetical protein